MKSASSKDIKSALEHLDETELSALCLRLARFKKENKELLTYLLFQSQDETQFIQDVRQEICDSFSEMNDSNLYLLKKSIRKIIRQTEKHIRYSGIESTAAELYMELLRNLKPYHVQISKSTVMKNMYASVNKKLEKIISDLHEDLQYDFHKALRSIALDF